MVFKKIFKILKYAFKLRRKPRRRRKRAAPRKKYRRSFKRLKQRRIKKTAKRNSRSHRKVVFSKRKKKATLPKKLKRQKPLKPKIAGIVTHYFPKVNAAVVQLKSPLSLGEPIWIKGKSTDFRQTVGSIQIDRKPLEKAKRGQEIGLEVFREVKTGDVVYFSNA
jgi:hypothetical protein